MFSRDLILCALLAIASLSIAGCQAPKFYAKTNSHTPAPQLGLETSPRKPEKKPPRMNSELADVPHEPASPTGTLLTRWLTPAPAKSAPAKRQPLPISDLPTRQSAADEF